MQTVTLKGERVVFPPLCPCCLAETDAEAIIEKSKGLYLIVAIVTRSISLRVPYCPECQEHARWFGRWGAFGAALTAGGAGALAGGVALIWREFMLTEGATPGTLNLVVFGVTIAVAGVVGFFQWRKRPRHDVDGRHARRGWAVQIRAIGLPYGANHLTLRFHSDIYARHFTELNPMASERVA